ncbi:MAG TPA: hypothetical protein VFU02_04595, partial [Polyangiaceae bacterium]|nr:hypothetical protein [Polyangiaceae bacterium]
RAVADGALPRARVVEAGRRVDALSRRFASPARLSSDLSVLACDEHLRLVDRMRAAAADAVELAGDPTAYRPLERDRTSRRGDS